MVMNDAEIALKLMLKGALYINKIEEEKGGVKR